MRKLTVSYRNESRGGRAYGSHRDISVPFLPLSGKWLGELGFQIGTKVEVECREGEIVIRKEPSTCSLY